MGILARILDLIIPRPDTARIVSEIAPSEFLALLAPRLTKQGIIALLPYRHPLVRAVIIEAKFHKNRKAYQLLASVLNEYLEAQQEEYAVLDGGTPFLVPIPLSKTRLQERGYNQVEEVLKAARKSYSRTVLLRTRHTTAQTSLSRRKRIENMHGAFTATPDPKATYLLIDDVVTTGATLIAARQALVENEVRDVQLLAFAY